MTANILIHCDALNPSRTPPRCRGFLTTRATLPLLARDEAARAGWTTDPGGIDWCPSCSRDQA